MNLLCVYAAQVETLQVQQKLASGLCRRTKAPAVMTRPGDTVQEKLKELTEGFFCPAAGENTDN